jgi:excisionase family DNA binding protein
MTDRSLNPAQRPASKGAADITGTARVRPVTKLRTIDETADLFNTSTRTVRRLIDSGALPVHRLGRSVRISDADIAAFLAANRSV